MKIVIALGGNALQMDKNSKDSMAQLESCRKTAKAVVNLIEKGHQISLVHGNGPQVGQIVSSIETAHKTDEGNVLFPFDVCDAFSQGYIGYHLQNAILEELSNRNIDKNVETIITQVVVSENDPAFNNPTKPIGSFYTKEEAEILEKKNGYILKEDSGRGYRRVVPSPKPIDIVEKKSIKRIVDDGDIVIACGGGGIPVIKKDSKFEGISAVIDKDFAAEKLAEILEADVLMILTAVSNVCINYNKENEKKLEKVTVAEIDKYIKENQFAEGSMLPKIEACKKFVTSNKKSKAIIGFLDEAMEVLKGEKGTTIIY